MDMPHRPPIVVIAFGTSTKALQSYDALDLHIRRELPGHDIYRAFSSRRITDILGREAGSTCQSPAELLTALHQRGEPWAVVQSLHLMGGHEFDRLITETSYCKIRTSVGLPLLSHPLDYHELCMGLAPLIHSHPDQAILLVGHGTDHPAWCAYPALENFMRHAFGPRVFVGAIEQFPDNGNVIEQIKATGHRKVCLIPLLLVAGMHFHRDITGANQHSWGARLAESGIEMEIIPEGLASLPAIGKIFCRHIRDALGCIPESVSSKN